MDELIKLPMYLGLEVKDKLLEKGIEPRKNNMGSLSLEFTTEELLLVTSLELQGSRRILDGIELLPNLNRLVIETDQVPYYVAEKDRQSITDEDIEKIGKLKQLEFLGIRNQSDISYVDLTRLSNLKFLDISNNVNLRDIDGLSALQNLSLLSIYGNDQICELPELHQFIMQNDNIVDIYLDLMLFPDAVGYDFKTNTLDEEAYEKIVFAEGQFYEKFSKITPDVMLLKQGKGAKSDIITTYARQARMFHDRCSQITRNIATNTNGIDEMVIGVEKYLAENITYDQESLNHKNSRVDNGIMRGAKSGANGAYNGIMFGSCVCEGYTRSMQYLLKLANIKTRNISCIAGEDTLGLSDTSEKNERFSYVLPKQGYHSIICIEDYFCFYCDPCWDASRYQKTGTLPYCLLNKEEISQSHTLSFLETSVSNEHLTFSRDKVDRTIAKLDNLQSSKSK